MKKHRREKPEFHTAASTLSSVSLSLLNFLALKLVRYTCCILFLFYLFIYLLILPILVFVHGFSGVSFFLRFLSFSHFPNTNLAAITRNFRLLIGISTLYLVFAQCTIWIFDFVSVFLGKESISIFLSYFVYFAFQT